VSVTPIHSVLQGFFLEFAGLILFSPKKYSQKVHRTGGIFNDTITQLVLWRSSMFIIVQWFQALRWPISVSALEREQFSLISKWFGLYTVGQLEEWDSVLYFSLGDFVIHPKQPEWGLGQIQSIVGMNVTVNFEHVGKQMINCALITLDPAPKWKKRIKISEQTG